MDAKKKFYDSNCNIFKEKNNLKVCKVISIVYCIVLDYIILKLFKNTTQIKDNATKAYMVKQNTALVSRVYDIHVLFLYEVIAETCMNIILISKKCKKKNRKLLKIYNKATTQSYCRACAFHLVNRKSKLIQREPEHTHSTYCQWHHRYLYFLHIHAYLIVGIMYLLTH